MSDESEKFWNMLIYKMPVTNKEMDEMAPCLLVGLIIAIFVAIVFMVCVVEFGEHPKNSSLIQIDNANVIQLEKDEAP